MLRTSLLISLILIFMGAPVSEATAQNNNIREANQLMRLGQYEEALEIYERILDRSPDDVQAVDRAATAYVNLKRYDEALEVLKKFGELDQSYPNVLVRIGEIYHMKGEREKAYQAWQELVDSHPRNVQVYRIVGENMAERREHERAAEMLKEARSQMNNEQLFSFEIAQYYLAAGNYEASMQEYSRMLRSNPGFLSTIQRQISRYEDEYYKDVAIMEFEEQSRQITTGSEAWEAHRKMLIWLYTERGFHRRAYTTAKNLEERSQHEIFPVFDLGKRLVNINEFELAEEALKNYSDKEDHSLFSYSREELALMYISKARYLIDNNLDFGDQGSKLYQQAYDLLEDLENRTQRYSRRADVLVLLTEISLDFLQDAEKARNWLEVFESTARRDRDEIMADYLKGRVYMFEQDFVRARLTLTRANRAARSGELAEKTRYFLSLNDFFAGDFEFAKIQMRSLQRQNTSYYANNAYRLRGWLQEGMLQDSASAELVSYSEARYLFEGGSPAESLEKLIPLLERPNTPMQTDAVLLISEILRKKSPQLGYAVLNRFIENGGQSSRLEQIMWARARLADAMVHIDSVPENSVSKQAAVAILKYAGIYDSEAGYDDGSYYFGLIGEDLDIASVIELYEDILMEFPSGFYGAACRERIRELQRTAATS